MAPPHAGSGGAEAALGARQHPGARLDAGEFGFGKTRSARRREPAVAFANAENASSSTEFFQPRSAGALEAITREPLFHPVVVRGEPVEFHPSRQIKPETIAPPV